LEYIDGTSRRTGLSRGQLLELDEVARTACGRFAQAEVDTAKLWLSPPPSPTLLLPSSMPVLIEVDFEVLVGTPFSPKVRVGGIIDRVDLVRGVTTPSAAPTGEDETNTTTFHLRVREFKSGQHWKKKKDSYGRSPLANMWDKSVQASIYAIALNSMKDSEGWVTPVSTGTLKVSPKTMKRVAPAPSPQAWQNVLVSLESIESDMVEERFVAERDRSAAVAKIVEVARNISRGAFQPTPGDIKCDYCSFAQMCPDSYGDSPSVHRL